MRIISLFAVTFFAGPAFALDLPDDLPTDLFSIAVETMTEPSLAEVAGICPDQLWADHTLSPAALSSEECGAPEECRQQCSLGDGAACFDLARIFQELEPDVPTSISSRLFALSCASGFAAGCTNRAAGILALRDTDPFSSRPLEQGVTCAARTFVISCQMGDAWGCAMHADDLMTGALGPEDPAAARKIADQACSIDQGDALGACSAAKLWVEE